MDDTKYWVGFNLVTGIGPMGFSRLLSYFKSAAAAWDAHPNELKRAGIDEKVVQHFGFVRSRINLDAEMERLLRAQIQVLTWEDPTYPRRLKEIYAAPPVLYVKGALVPEDEWAVAVVGTRKATAYGREVAIDLVGELARNGITIVSGLARGIDSIAHRAALDAGGRTIAVLGCGLDIIYPSEHTHLAQQILEHGALLSDYPLGTKPEGRNFPPRNRIMSGLSLGVLVVEAGETSGALITANYALEQNREVFAVPGSIFGSASRGTNCLIQNGEAKLVQDAQDILEELNLSAVSQQMELKQLVPADDNEALLAQCLSAEPLHIDELRRTSGLPITTVSSTLAMMELKGIVRQVGAMNYVLARGVRL